MLHNLGELSARIYEISSAHGFWPPEGRNFGEMIALAHSELSEALEAHRDGDEPLWFKHDDVCVHSPLNDLHDLRAEREDCTCTPKPEGAAVELMDCIIRALDTFNHPSMKGADPDTVLECKMKYNASRPYKHGRSY